MNLENYPALRKLVEYGKPKEEIPPAPVVVPPGGVQKSTGLQSVLSSLAGLISRRQGRKRGFKIRFNWMKKNLDVEYREEE